MKKSKLLIVVAFLSLAVSANALMFMDGTYLDPDKTYNEWCYMWIGRIDSAHHHGTRFTYDYCLYDPYEKNGKTYRSVLTFTDAFGWIYLVNLSFPKAPGVRMENGRIYVDREEYLCYLEEDFQTSIKEITFGHQSNPVGDKDYIPYPQTDDGELVLYDFNMQPGDKFPPVEGHEEVSVVSVGTMMTRDGISRRLLTLSNGCKLLEGIGCLNSPGMFFCYLNPSDGMARYFHDVSLLSYYRVDKEWFKVYSWDDDGMAGMEEPVHEVHRQDDVYHSLQGTCLPDAPSRGIYIKDGRKHIAK